MKRLVLALLLFIFKELAVVSVLTLGVDITLVNSSMFACERYRRHNMMLSMCSYPPLFMSHKPVSAMNKSAQIHIN
ncbi:conserved hypothetical protein [Klebsiella variicola]|nr:conserved hypothetical protein [Klebsiella variicola]HBV6416251.1 hypothetical protein [Klebsiella variicola]